MTQDRKDLLQGLLDRRWAYHGRVAHEAASALSPLYRDTSDAAKLGLRKCLPTFFSEESDQLLALEEYEDWSRIVFSGMEATAAKKSPGYVWWSMFGSTWPHLRKVAQSLLGQTAASGAAERGFSAYGDIKTRKRNCLSQETTDSLVRLYFNKRSLPTTQLAREFWGAYEVFEPDDVEEET
eukprot:TRINITY_DN4069_c0_g2_i1.p1 TRINITY_DN4069_c0_g2~~TRINITY_DN4069_c0_g2_i1.p1  ORF type:complete len:181 (-),score=4.00 TRINITY_DN4069_c0_g2_i1:141-683(-)